MSDTKKIIKADHTALHDRIKRLDEETATLRAELERLKQSKSCVEIPKGTLQDGDVIEFKMQSRSVELSKLHSELNRLRECEAIVRELAGSKWITDQTIIDSRIKARQWVKDNPE